MIFRDDDISYKTNLDQFKQVNSLFKKYGVTHTIAVICKDIHKAPELINYINENNIDVQVHCFEHTDFTQLTETELKAQFKNSIAAIKKHFKKTPTVFYPPWNKSNETVKAVATEFGLTVSNNKISLIQYLNGKRDKVTNFHSWSDECIDLETVLKIYNK